MLKGAGIDGTGSPDGAGGDAWLVPGDMLKGVGCARGRLGRKRSQGQQDR